MTAVQEATTPADTDLTRAFRDSARDLLQREFPLSRLRELRDTEPGYQRQAWQKLAQAGWTGLLIGEESGGLGLGLREVAAVAREIGHHPLSEPVAAVCVQASTALNLCPPSGLRRQLLERIASGETIAGLAWQEHQRQAEFETPAASIESAGGKDVLTGHKQWVYPAAADGWLVTARRGQDLELCWIPADAPGLRVDTHARVDGTLAADLYFDRVPLPEAPLARGAEVAAAVATANRYTRVAQSAELLGIAEKTCAMTLDYLKTRIQFNRPIGANQALQHRMVDAYLQVRLAEAVLQDSAGDAQHDGQRFQAWASRLKSRCAHAALHMSRLAIQLHGAIGYTDEFDAGLYLKRALHLCAWLGGVEENRAMALRDMHDEDAGESSVAAVKESADAQPAMDWNALPEDEFRARIRAFVEQYYPAHLRHPPQRLHWAEMREWYMALSRKGWLAPAWPKEYGGMALDPDHILAMMEEMESHGVARMPDQGIINIGPILIKYGTPAQRAQYLPRIISGQNIWCQGYSEPNAGSDLASLRTEAVRDGDSFVVNGQKIWTTLAQDATHIFMLVRTDKTVKKQAGISFLLADIATPGITVRPIRNIGGEEEFCEVFFDNVRVPKENLVGEINQGWTIAKALLEFERIFVGSPSQARYALNQLRRVGEAQGLFDDPRFKSLYADALLDVADLQSLYTGFANIVKRGEKLPASVSLLKIWATEVYSRIAMHVVEASYERGGDAGSYEAMGSRITPAGRLYNSAITTIYGGTNEIQRNILAKLVLELPS